MKDLVKLFKAFGVVSINSRTFDNVYYYEYSLENDDAGAYRVTRRLRNRYSFSDDDPATAVETDEQIEACKQALMYNFPYAFNIDGSVAIDLPELAEPTTPDTADGTESASKTL